MHVLYFFQSTLQFLSPNILKTRQHDAALSQVDGLQCYRHTVRLLFCHSGFVGRRTNCANLGN